jgi:hypothetical protein
METEAIINLTILGVSAITTVIVSVGGAYVVIKTLLTKHEEKIGRIEQDIVEIKEERKQIHIDMKDMLTLLNKVYSKVGVLDERTKK